MLPSIMKLMIINKLLSPMVYFYINKGVLLYIGSTRNGMERTHNDSHHLKHVRVTPHTQVQIFPCTSERSARSIEKEAIGRYRPIFNELPPRWPKDIDYYVSTQTFKHTENSLFLNFI